jgi:predicted ATPase
VSGGQQLPAEVVEKIVAKTDGVPLFIEELTKSLLESGSLRLEQGVYTLDGQLDALSLPSTLQGSLLARLDRLPGGRSVASVGAAIGRTFSYELLQAVTELDGAVLEPILDRLIEAQLLFRWGLGPQASYAFKHALVQDAAYGTLLKSQRRALHARIATILRDRFPDVVAHQPDVLAPHYTWSGLTLEAIEFRRRAATIAVQNSANAEAIAHIQAALEQNDRIENADDRVTNEIALRQMLGVPLEARSWGSKDIEENLLRLHKLIKKTSDQKALLSVLHGLCGVHILGGRLSAARKFARKMSRAAQQGNEVVFSVLSERSLGMCHFFAGELATAIAHFDKVISLCDRAVRDQAKTYYVADPDLVARCMSAWALLLLGDSPNADRHVKVATDLVEARDHIFSRIYTFGILASYYQTKEDWRTALHFSTLAMELSQENNNRYWEAWAQIVKGWALAASGERPGNGRAG